jgi:hypothetical protein
MTETFKDKPASAVELSASTPKVPRLGRRLFILKATAVLTGAAAFPVSRAQAKEPLDWDSGDVSPDLPRGSKKPTRPQAPSGPGKPPAKDRDSRDPK